MAARLWPEVPSVARNAECWKVLWRPNIGLMLTGLNTVEGERLTSACLFPEEVQERARLLNSICIQESSANDDQEQSIRLAWYLSKMSVTLSQR